MPGPFTHHRHQPNKKALEWVLDLVAFLITFVGFIGLFYDASFSDPEGLFYWFLVTIGIIMYLVLYWMQRPKKWW